MRSMSAVGQERSTQRRARTSSLWSALLLAIVVPAWAQNDHGRRRPVIDIHGHTAGGFPGGTPMCPFPPQFLASDPRGREEAIGWSKQDCATPLQPSASPDEYMKAVLAEWERLNVTAVVMGDPASVRRWKAAAPQR